MYKIEQSNIHGQESTDNYVIEASYISKVAKRKLEEKIRKNNNGKLVTIAFPTNNTK